MTTLTEGNLQISFPSTMRVRRFDEAATHGLTHCMKAVDFVVEDDARIHFIEFKDPEHPNARSQSRDKFVNRLQSGKLNEELKYKYRDSFLYEWASDSTNKPICYWVLICVEQLTAAELMNQTDELKRVLPLLGPSSGSWKKKIVADCMVFNLNTWNQYMTDFPVSRM